MQSILLFGAGKSATCLIDYLVKESAKHNWNFIVADGNLAAAQSKIGAATHAKAVAVNVENEAERQALVQQASIVVSLLPPSLHFLVAQDCIAFNKNLLTASYVDEKIKALHEQIEKKGLLFLCEMGLDPGIDHMSAMQLINRIQKEGGTITSFKSHCGGLVAPESDNNPWHYKISWNPRNVVLAGNAGAEYKEDGKLQITPYQHLFKSCPQVTVEGLDPLAYYPNRDSLSYIPVYGLQQATTFIRTTLRHPAFCNGWNAIVDAGLTNEKNGIDPNERSIKNWSKPIETFVNPTNQQQLAYLGLFDDAPLPENAQTSADVLQYLLETKLAMQPHDRDMIVMLHEIDYLQQGHSFSIKSSLVVKGEDNLRTAMAKTVGLPLGIAAKLILQEKISLKGLHIPIVADIYEPVLKELEEQNIRFHEVISTN